MTGAVGHRRKEEEPKTQAPAYGGPGAPSAVQKGLREEELVDGESGGGDGGAGFGVVVVVEEGFGGLGCHGEARLEREGEGCTTGAGPEIEDYAIGLDFVALDIPSSGEGVEGGAIHIGAGRETDFGEHHAVAIEADTFRVDGAEDGIADGGRGAIEFDGVAQGFGIAAADGG